MKTLPLLYPGDQVLTKLDTQKSWLTKATVMKGSVTPRSYLVETEQGGMLRRNRRHLQGMPAGKPSITTSVNNPQHETALPMTQNADKTLDKTQGSIRTDRFLVKKHTVHLSSL